MLPRATAEGMKVRDYAQYGPDPTSVVVMTEDGITTTGHIIIGALPIVVHMTRKSNLLHNKFNCVGNLYRIVAIFLIQGVVPFTMMINGE